jgi:chromosome segregation ATPase
MSEDKKNTLKKINDEIEKLKNRIENDQEVIKKINELLKKADQRLKEEPKNYNRWVNIIENLENSLVERRRILQGRTVNLQKLQKEDQELLIGTTSTESSSLPEILLSEKELELIDNRKVKDMQLALKILETPADKWGEVSIGEILK